MEDGINLINTYNVRKNSHNSITSQCQVSQTTSRTLNLGLWGSGGRKIQRGIRLGLGEAIYLDNRGSFLISWNTCVRGVTEV